MRAAVKSILLTWALGIGLFGALRAGEPKAAPAAAPVQADLRELQTRVLAKVRANQKSADALAPEIATFAMLSAKYRGQPEAEAAILFSRGLFTLQVLRDDAEGKRLLEQVIADYPASRQAAYAKNTLHVMSPEGQAERAAAEAAEKAAREALIGRPAPEIEFEWSSREGGLRKLSELRGQVIVLDFWATWCAPCIASFPRVRAEVEHFKASPVVFLGVTSLQGRVHGLEAKPIPVKDQPEKEYALTADFMKKHEMTWPVAFSTQKVFNPDYGVRGIPNVVIIAPDGTVRHVGLNPHDPQADVVGKVTAILKEFNLPVPATKA